jgi:hypothetical protein
MIEQIYKCEQCATPCILQVKYACNLVFEANPPFQCPYNEQKVKWELVE